MKFDKIDESEIPNSKWDKLIGALENLPKGKAIKLSTDTPRKDATSIRQKIYQDIGSGKFSVLQFETFVYIKHMR